MADDAEKEPEGFVASNGMKYDVICDIIMSMASLKRGTPKCPISWRLHRYIHLFALINK